MKNDDDNKLIFSKEYVNSDREITTKEEESVTLSYGISKPRREIIKARIKK